MNYLEFAIKMELDGQAYYKEQAEKNEGNSLSTVFMKLAEDEKAHAEILKNKMKQVSYELKATSALAHYQNVFSEVGDFQKDTKATPEQLDAYRLALKKEEESIALYQKILSEVADKQEKELFAYLLEQEKQHYEIFNDVVKHVARAKEWVEDAEFGVRKTY